MPNKPKGKAKGQLHPCPYCGFACFCDSTVCEHNCQLQQMILAEDGISETDDSDVGLFYDET